MPSGSCSCYIRRYPFRSPSPSPSVAAAVPALVVAVVAAVPAAAVVVAAAELVAVEPVVGGSKPPLRKPSSPVSASALLGAG